MSKDIEYLYGSNYENDLSKKVKAAEKMGAAHIEKREAAMEKAVDNFNRERLQDKPLSQCSWREVELINSLNQKANSEKQYFGIMKQGEDDTSASDNPIKNEINACINDIMNLPGFRPEYMPYIKEIEQLVELLNVEEISAPTVLKSLRAFEIRKSDIDRNTKSKNQNRNHTLKKNCKRAKKSNLDNLCINDKIMVKTLDGSQDFWSRSELVDAAKQCNEYIEYIDNYNE